APTLRRGRPVRRGGQLPPGPVRLGPPSGGSGMAGSGAGSPLGGAGAGFFVGSASGGGAVSPTAGRITGVTVAFGATGFGPMMTFSGVPLTVPIVIGGPAGAGTIAFPFSTGTSFGLTTAPSFIFGSLW